MFAKFVFCLVFVEYIAISHALPAPETRAMPSCKTQNTDVNECLKTHLQEAIKYSSKGNSQFSIPPLDPYFISKLVMSPSKNTEGVVIEIKNATTFGFSKAVLKKVNANPAKGVFEGQYTVPVSTLLSNYNLTGKIFSMPINGKGKANVTMYDVQHSVKVLGDVNVNKTNGKKYLDVKSATLRVKPRKMKVRFDDLFKDNRELGDVINNMLNDNWEDIFIRLQPKLEEEMSKHLFAMVKRFFDNMPYSDLFPDV